MDLEGSGRGLIEILSRNFPSETEQKHKKLGLADSANPD
jgi:hypothetical protein